MWFEKNSIIKIFKCWNFKNFKSPKKAFDCLSIDNYHAITLYFNYIHKSTLSKLSYCEKNPSWLLSLYWYKKSETPCIIRNVILILNIDVHMYCTCILCNGTLKNISIKKITLPAWWYTHMHIFFTFCFAMIYQYQIKPKHLIFECIYLARVLNDVLFIKILTRL